MQIAVLQTCYNRKEKTLAFLRSMARLETPTGTCLDIWLNDDGSTDGTSAAVRNWYKENTPSFTFTFNLHLLHGSGHDYWCGGMRRAWQAAVAHGKYDYFLWANDDVEWYSNALVELLSVASNPDCAPVGLVCGCFCDPKTGEFTYGGRTEKQLLPPNGAPQTCRYVHGNTVLVPWSTYEKLGVFDMRWRHGFGDTDYGFCCIAKGLKCWITEKYIGTCEQHDIKAPWFSSSVPFANRWHLALKPVGGDFGNFISFRRKHFVLRWPIDVVKFVLQVCFPKPFEWYRR